MTDSAPRQHRQPSRKGKRAWRKNVDISDVQQGLDDAAEEAIRTGGIISEKPAAELFVVDTSGSEEIRRRTHKTTKQLKADQIILGRSKLPPVESRKRGATSRTTNGILEPNHKQKEKSRVEQGELQRLKERAYRGEAVYKDVVQTGETPIKDPWTEDASFVAQNDSFNPEPKPKVAPKTLKEMPISLLENGRPVPLVVKPKPGLSYNPRFDDYEKLIQEEGSKEEIAEQHRIMEETKEEEKRARIQAAQTEIERSEYYTDDESVWEGIESDYEGAVWLPKRRPERKTPAERNKIKRKKAIEREMKHKRRIQERGQRGLRNEDLEREYTTALIDSNPPAANDNSDADGEVDDRRLRKRKFGTIHVPEKPLEVVLADELQDSLRLLRPEGNLLKERFRNYLVGGKIETRRPGFQAKKAKRKATEKWTHKDFSVPA